MTNLFLDTEFNGFGGDLISMALVDDSGRKFYEVLVCDDPQPWIITNVLPVLDKEPIEYSKFQATLSAFLRIYSRVNIIADWPEDIAFFCKCLLTNPGERFSTPSLKFQIWDDKHFFNIPSNRPHNALADALALRDSYNLASYVH